MGIGKTKEGQKMTVPVAKTRKDAKLMGVKVKKGAK